MQKFSFHSAKIYLMGISLLFSSAKALATDYSISFTASGASTTIDSVKVQNLSKNISVTLPNGNALTMAEVPNAVDQLNANLESVSIYPNPIQISSALTFNSTKAGMTQIRAYSLDGKKILEFSGKTEEGTNSFKLSLPAGVYSIQIIGNGYSYNAKAISQSLTCGLPQVSLIGQSTKTRMQKTKATGPTTILFTAGDQLLFTAHSGKYATVVADRPTGSKTINIEFAECKDADNNNYAVVRIGDQLWMAENIKTTKYNDGSAIPNATDSTAWANSVNGSYCWFNYDTSNKDIYGALYNWQCVGTSKLAPTGWHVAYDEEWTELENYLAANGYNYDRSTTGNKMAKSLASSNLWLKDVRTDTIAGAIANNLSANNASGFSALPGGCLYGTFNNANSLNGGYVTNWWTASLNKAGEAWSRDLFSNSPGTFRYYDAYSPGKSVRCVRYTGSSPRVITVIPGNITSTSAVTGGNIVYDGGSAVVAKGVCWSTTSSPTIDLATKTNEGTGSGAYVSTITGLTLSTLYYVRAYVTNGTTTTYGMEQQIKTPLNDYDGNYSCTGYRIRPGNPTEPVVAGTIEKFNAVDATTVLKAGFGNYTVYYVKIEVTTNTMIVGGVTCFKVNATPVDINNNVVGGMFTTWTGDALTAPTPPVNPTDINYYNPVTKTFVLNCYYTSGAGNRIMYEVLTRQ